jgi:curved DNA-binding protein CbpA
MILGVPQTATLEQITKSYRRLALKLHPDRPANGGSTQAFQLVSATSNLEVMDDDQRQFPIDQYIRSVLTPGTAARPSLRHFERRARTPGVRPYLPFHQTKPAYLPEEYLPEHAAATITSASDFDSSSKSKRQHRSNRRSPKGEGRTQCDMENHAKRSRNTDLRIETKHTTLEARDRESCRARS